MATTHLVTLAQSAVVPAVMILLAVAVYSDCRWRLIHNALTFPFMVLGLVLHLATEGAPGLGWAVLGLFTGCGLMMIPFTFGQMGGGDVKLLAALGALLGAHAILNVFLYTTLAGGVLAVLYAVRHHEGLNTVRRAGQLASALVTPPSGTSQDAPRPAITIPYGVAIAAGACLYLAFGKVV